MTDEPNDKTSRLRAFARLAALAGGTLLFCLAALVVSAVQVAADEALWVHFAASETSAHATVIQGEFAVAEASTVEIGRRHEGGFESRGDGPIARMDSSRFEPVDSDVASMLHDMLLVLVNRLMPQSVQPMFERFAGENFGFDTGPLVCLRREAVDGESDNCFRRPVRWHHEI